MALTDPTQPESENSLPNQDIEEQLLRIQVAQNHINKRVLTDPVDDVLPRLNETAAYIFNEYFIALHELVCYGTHILTWLIAQNEGKIPVPNETASAAPLTFRYIIELLDAISVQVSVGAFNPCKVLLRVLLESVFALEWLLKDDRERRAAAMFIVDHYRNLAFYQGFVRGTSENATLIKKLKDHGTYLVDINNYPRAKENVDRLTKLINSPIYHEARKEYIRFTTEDKHSKPRKNNLSVHLVKWYQLFKGPVHTGELAEKLGKYELYRFFYQDWSNQIHGTNLSSGVLSQDENGFGWINQIRDPTGGEDIVKSTIILILDLFMSLAITTLPERRQEVVAWIQLYKQDFSALLDKN